MSGFRLTARSRSMGMARRAAHLGSFACLLVLVGCGTRLTDTAGATSQALPTAGSAADTVQASESVTTAPITTGHIPATSVSGTSAASETVAGESNSSSGEATTLMAVPAAADLVGIPARELSRIPGTIHYYLSPEYVESQETRDRRAATTQAVNDCMTAAGVSYGAPEVATPTSDPVWDEFYASQGTREYAEKWGYGLSVRPEYDIPDAPVEVRLPDPLTLESDPAYRRAWDGPLRTELEELRTEYFYGEHPEGLSADLDQRINELSDAVLALDSATAVLPGAGCSDVQAVADRVRYPILTANPEDPDSLPENALVEFEPLLDQADLIWPQVLSDPEMVAPLEAWRACMAEAGYGPYLDPGDANREIADRWGKFEGWEIPEDTHHYGGFTSFGAAYAEGEKPTEGLAELQKDELAVALVDFDCTVPLTPVVDRVMSGMEQQFVADHHQQLIDYRAAVTKDW